MLQRVKNYFRRKLPVEVLAFYGAVHKDLRGNIATRIEKIQAQEFSSLIARLKLEGKTLEAIERIKIEFKSRPEGYDRRWVLHYLGTVLWQHGRWDDAFDIILEYEQRKQSIIESYGHDNFLYRFINSDFAPIGHTALLDTFIKLSVLGFLPSWKLLIQKNEHFANRALLDKMAQFFQYTNLRREDFSAELYDSLVLPISLIPFNDGSWRSLPEAAAIAEQEWAAQKRGPVLSLTAEESHKGRKALALLGIPEDAWFVAVHVRHSPWCGKNLCNVDINTYLPAFRLIVEKGGYVVRIGDNRMPMLPEMDKVIDLAHHQAKNEFLHMYVIAACKFFIGTSSGPLSVPQCFGVPVLWTNAWLCMSHGIPNLVRVPILYKDPAGKLIRIDDLMTREFRFCSNRSTLIHNGMIPVDNTSDDICRAVEEMFARVEGGFDISNEYDQLQKEWRGIADRSMQRYVTMGKLEPVSYDFAKKFAFIL